MRDIKKILSKNCSLESLLRKVRRELGVKLTTCLPHKPITKKTQLFKKLKKNLNFCSKQKLYLSGEFL